MKTTAVEDGNHIVLNGQKTFANNSINCDLVIVAARDPEIKQEHQAVDLYTLSKRALPVLKKANRLKKSGGMVRIRQNYWLRIPKENRLGDKGSGIHQAHDETPAGNASSVPSAR